MIAAAAAPDGSYGVAPGPYEPGKARAMAKAVRKCTEEQWLLLILKVFRDCRALTPGATSNANSESCFLCHDCPCESVFRQFSCLNGLLAHQRTLLGFRCPVRSFAGADGKCPICGTEFQARLRFLAHLSDSMRPKCRDACFQSRAQPIPPGEVDRIDALDRAERTEARRSGHTHVLTCRPAKRAGGLLAG